MTSLNAIESSADTPATPRKNRRRRLSVWVMLAVALLVLITGLWIIGVFGGNVRTIQAGRAYRSATLTGMNYTGITARLAGNDLESVLRRDQIGTVICLRGGSPSDDWYRQELDTCRQENVAHLDIPFSAQALPPPGAMKALLDAFDHARYPVLLHCQGGSDRTGLASTVYANLFENMPLDKAESEELTFRYGHIAAGKTRAMDNFFDLYRKDSGGMSLRAWILMSYPRVYAEQAQNGSAAK